MEMAMSILLYFGIVGLAAATHRIDIFTQTPENPVLEEETVTVHCVGLGSSLRWYVNTILQTGSNEAIFKIESADIIEIGDSYYWNSTMTTIATLDRNYTNIRCSINGESTLDASNDTTITLAGPPLAPPTFLEDLYEGTVLRLSWMEPYSPTPYPVTSYHVVIYNETATFDNVLVNSSLNLSQHHYDYVKLNNSAACPIIQFAVSAVSTIGSSNVSTELGVFPMIPDINNLKILHEVVLVDGRTPRLTVWFQEPIVCPLQDQANYTMEVLDEGGDVVTSSGLLVARGGSDKNVITRFTSGLRSNMKVSIRLTLYYSSMLWMQSATKDNITVPSLEGPAKPTSPIVTTTTSVVKETSTSLDSTTIIIIAMVSVGVTVLVCVIMIVFMALLIVWSKGRRPVITVATDFSPGIVPATSSEFKLQAPPKGKNKVPKSLPVMEMNPIYDGPMYDSPGGESLKQLLGNCSVPSTPATDYPRYSGMPPPTLPPPRKTLAGRDHSPPQFSFSSTSSSSSSNTTCNDTYTEMKPTSKGSGILRPPDVLPAVYEAMGGEPLYDISK